MSIESRLAAGAGSSVAATPAVVPAIAAPATPRPAGAVPVVPPAAVPGPVPPGYPYYQSQLTLSPSASAAPYPVGSLPALPAPYVAGQAYPPQVIMVYPAGSLPVLPAASGQATPGASVQYYPDGTPVTGTASAPPPAAPPPPSSSTPAQPPAATPSHATPGPDPKPAPAPAAKPASPPAPPPPPPRTYTVVQGDSLSGIAQSQLGDGNRWPEIYDLNKPTIGPDPNVIQVGMVLTLPGSDPAHPAAPSQAPASPPASKSHATPPYINQYQPAGASQGYTNGPANCGPTSMAMVARAFGWGKNLTDAKLINTLGAMGGTSGDGTGLDGMVAMAKGIGLTGEIKGPGANVAWIKSQLEAGKFVVANGDYFAMPPHGDPARVGTAGHYILVTGYQNGQFTVNDPADPNAHTLTPDQLAHFIDGCANGGFQIAVG